MHIPSSYILLMEEILHHLGCMTPCKYHNGISTVSTCINHIHQGRLVLLLVSNPHLCHLLQLCQGTSLLTTSVPSGEGVGWAWWGIKMQVIHSIAISHHHYGIAHGLKWWTKNWKKHLNIEWWMWRTTCWSNNEAKYHRFRTFRTEYPIFLISDFFCVRTPLTLKNDDGHLESYDLCSQSYWMLSKTST